MSDGRQGLYGGGSLARRRNRSRFKSEAPRFAALARCDFGEKKKKIKRSNQDRDQKGRGPAGEGGDRRDFSPAAFRKRNANNDNDNKPGSEIVLFTITNGR